jgi:hypothetical protein
MLTAFLAANQASIEALGAAAAGIRGMEAAAKPPPTANKKFDLFNLVLLEVSMPSRRDSPPRPPG